MQKKKCIVLGISGGIAAYKACELTSMLTKKGYDIRVVMTENATRFVTPLTLETLSKNKVATNMYAQKAVFDIEHISLAKAGDLLVIAPATANIIAKLAYGIADDTLTATFLASTAQKVICPAMNNNMYLNAKTQENLQRLRQNGCIVLSPNTGMLACGDIGAGRMSEPHEIAESIEKILYPKQDLTNKTAIITAGATREEIDAVRFISNYSSGKMGIALAQAASQRGCKVILVTANVTVDVPDNIEVIRVNSTEEMYNAVIDNLKVADIIIKAAAPSDYKVINRADHKIKHEKLVLELQKNIDIAYEVGQQKGDRKLIIFAAETEDLIMNAKQKLAKKNADMIIANDITKEGAGFNCDTNIVTILKSNGDKKSLPLMSKRELSDIILDNIYN